MIFSTINDIDYLKIKSIQSLTQFNGCDYSKTYLQSWNFYSSKAVEIAFEDDIVFLRFKPNQKYYKEPLKYDYIYIAPLCTIDKIKKAFLMLKEYANKNNFPLQIMDIPEEYLPYISDMGFILNEDKNYAEYLYLPHNLINLSGKKYHSKRNHIKNFDKKYKYEFITYDSSYKNLVLELIDNWQENKYSDKKMEEDERIAIDKALELVEIEENVFADILMIDNKIAAFSLGEITPSNVGIVHIEKGDINFDGVYSKINNLFATKHFSNVRIINRQEDMGLEGLKKSKMSYHPVAFNKKFYACID